MQLPTPPPPPMPHYNVSTSHNRQTIEADRFGISNTDPRDTYFYGPDDETLGYAPRDTLELVAIEGALE